MAIFDPLVFDPLIFDAGVAAPVSSGITVAIVTQDMSLPLLWRSLTITETIGGPDTLSCDLFELDSTVRDLLGAGGYLYTHVRRNGDLLFSGLVNGIRRRNNHGVVTYTLSGVGWEFLAPRRLVGRPFGDVWEIQQDGDPDRLPTAIAVDPNATSHPSIAGVQALWTAYWNSPWPLDLTTYVEEFAADPGSLDQISWSGSDMDGAMDDLCAAGSAAAMWWLGNDSPDAQQVLAPNLALHSRVVALPDAGDDGDDLLMGFPSADPPTGPNIAPYGISDAPDFVTTIMATSAPELQIDSSGRVDAVYVRGATGFVQEVIATDIGYVPGSVVKQGGTGFVSSPGGLWGEAYVDAPAAITSDQRDAFGSAYIAAHGGQSVSGTIAIDSYDGWHKGQAVQVTDAGLGLDARWLLIRSVTIKANDPSGESMHYDLNVGDQLTAQLGYQLRRQRLKEQRQEIAPATRFIPYGGDQLLRPGETAAQTFQLANDAGQAKAVEGVTAVWHILMNGTDLADVEDTGAAYYLTDLVETTDVKGQVTATLHAGASATAADDSQVWVAMVP